MFFAIWNKSGVIPGWQGSNSGSRSLPAFAKLTLVLSRKFLKTNPGTGITVLSHPIADPCSQITTLLAEATAIKQSLDESHAENLKKEENISGLNENLRSLEEQLVNKTRSSQSWQEKYLKSTSRLTDLEKHTKAQDEIQQEMIWKYRFIGCLNKLEIVRVALTLK